MKIQFSLKVETVIHVDVTGKSEQECLDVALASVRADLEAGEITAFDVRVLKKQEISE